MGLFTRAGLVFTKILILLILLVLQFFKEFCSFLRMILRVRLIKFFNIFKFQTFCPIPREIESHILNTSYINHLGQSDMKILEKINKRSTLDALKFLEFSLFLENFP